jgi:hypothetical protein
MSTSDTDDDDDDDWATKTRVCALYDAWKRALTPKKTVNTKKRKWAGNENKP